jgi:ATP-dependent helicase/nuclease subunit A
LLSSALDFESNAAPSLQRFLDWFARGEVEIVRDPSAPLDAVRVMTVHGSKGLQSPVVILADSCADPDRRGGGFGAAFADLTLPEGPSIPIFRPRKGRARRAPRRAAGGSDRREREEHWRLLYVAATRAEERLYIGGSLGPADRKGPPIASWWSALDSALLGLGAEWQDDPHWGRARRFGEAEFFTKAAPRAAAAGGGLPGWIGEAAPLEARPPRPLAPSALGEDDVADPPALAGDAGGGAARAAAPPAVRAAPDVPGRSGRSAPSAGSSAPPGSTIRRFAAASSRMPAASSPTRPMPPCSPPERSPRRRSRRWWGRGWSSPAPSTGCWSAPTGSSSPTSRPAAGRPPRSTRSRCRTSGRCRPTSKP